MIIDKSKKEINKNNPDSQWALSKTPMFKIISRNKVGLGEKLAFKAVFDSLYPREGLIYKTVSNELLDLHINKNLRNLPSKGTSLYRMAEVILNIRSRLYQQSNKQFTQKFWNCRPFLFYTEFCRSKLNLPWEPNLYECHSPFCPYCRARALAGLFNKLNDKSGNLGLKYIMTHSEQGLINSYSLAVERLKENELELRLHLKSLKLSLPAIISRQVWLGDLGYWNWKLDMVISSKNRLPEPYK